MLIGVLYIENNMKEVTLIMYRIHMCIILLGLTLLSMSVAAMGERIDQIGEDVTIIQMETVPRSGDSGCILLHCAGDCVENFGNWQCWTRETYERYDDQMRPLPIQVRVKGDCLVSTLYGNYFWSCTDTEIGSGRASAYTKCTRFAVLVTLAGNDGWCLCQER